MGCAIQRHIRSLLKQECCKRKLSSPGKRQLPGMASERGVNRMVSRGVRKRVSRLPSGQDSSSGTGFSVQLVAKPRRRASASRTRWPSGCGGGRPPRSRVPRRRRLEAKGRCRRPAKVRVALRRFQRRGTPRQSPSAAKASAKQVKDAKPCFVCRKNIRRLLCFDAEKTTTSCGEKQDKIYTMLTCEQKWNSLCKQKWTTLARVEAAGRVPTCCILAKTRLCKQKWTRQWIFGAATPCNFRVLRAIGTCF